MVPHPSSPTPLALALAGVLCTFIPSAAQAEPAAQATAERWTAASPKDADMAWAWDAREVQGPGGLRCGKPTHEFVRLPAQGLMQGTLGATQKEAERRARALGVLRFPVATHRVNCDNATFDLHLLGNDRALLGWDGRVLTLRRTAADASPLGTVQRLLEMHLASPMAFTPAHARAAAPWLDAALNKRIAAYFARPRPQDEVPPIDGDPFTNSQEEPERVTLEPGPTQGDRASVVVHLGDAGRQWQLTYRLRRTGSQWRIDDIDNGDTADGMKLSALLRQ